MKQTLERELKLQAPPGFTLPPLPGAPFEPRRFTSTYYDTPDLLLARQGITLRRRVEDRRGVWQLKIPRTAARLELEEPGPPAGPPESMRKLLTASLRGAEVAPVAKIRTLRRGVVVEDPERGALAEVVLDSAAVLQDGRVANRFGEIEIELVNGREDDLEQLRSALVAAGAVVGDQQPKAFRALNLTRLEEPGERPDNDLARLSRSISDQFKVIVSHDPGTRLGLDPEDLHQHRVGVRRLRSLLWAAKGMLDPDWSNSLRAELEWIGDQMNPVRDLDVMIPYLRADVSQLGPEDAAGVEPFLKLLEEEREASRAPMLAALESERYLTLLRALEEATRSLRVRPPSSTLRDGAVKAFRRLRRAAGSMAEPYEDEGLHLVRRLAKRARYSAEAAGGKKAGKFLAAIKGLQDVLGDHQDASVAEQRIRSHLPRVEGTRAAFALGRLAERQSFKKQARRKEFAESWRAVERAGRKAWLQ